MISKAFSRFGMAIANKEANTECIIFLTLTKFETSTTINKVRTDRQTHPTNQYNILH